MSKDDAINPEHYKGDLVARIAEYFKLSAYMFSALKYLLRAGKKTDRGMSKNDMKIRDINKSIWYLKREVMRLEGHERIGNLE